MSQVSKGLVYIFTGDGKGKTSAALGVAVRAVGAGMTVAIVQWYKEASWQMSEEVIDGFKGKLKMYPMGVGFRIKQYESRIKNTKGKVIKVARIGKESKVVDKATEVEHRQAALEALNKAKKLLTKVNVLVLDEVCNAVDDGLIDLVSLIDLISKRNRTHLILTGRNASQALVDQADLVTEMTKVKHPYDQGTLAIKGLDF